MIDTFRPSARTEQVYSLVVFAAFFAAAMGVGCAADPTAGPMESVGLKAEPILGASCRLESECGAGEECVRPVCIRAPCDFPGECQLKTNYQDAATVGIPDNSTTGVTRVLNVPAHGRSVETLSVFVNITHSYRGDLKVTLTSPAGTTRVLHDRAGGGADNLTIDLPGDIGFAGENAEGNWTLKVYDLANLDTGQLVSWRLVFGFGTPDEPTSDVWARVALATPIQSAHNYANNVNTLYDLSRVTGVAGAARIRLHFSRVSLETNYDVLEITNAAGILVQTLTGSLGEVTSTVIEGSVAKVRLRSDVSVTDWGFAIDAIDVYGKGCLADSDCESDYSCPTTRTCVASPCFQECVPRTTTPACVATGCGGEVCSDRPVVTACVAQPWHACFDSATCQRQAAGSCGWTPSVESAECLASFGQGVVAGGRCNATAVCNNGLYCDKDGGSSDGICRAVGVCEEVSDCSDAGNSWVHTACAGTASCTAGACAWRCGTATCREGDTRTEDCNTCSCTGGAWRCTTRSCPASGALGASCGGLTFRSCNAGLACDLGRIAVPSGGSACTATRSGVCVNPTTGAGVCAATSGIVCGCNGQSFDTDCERSGIASYSRDGACVYGQSIPDGSDTGVTVAIDAVARASFTRAWVQVDIAHTYRGDLVVSVDAPDGTRYVLTNRSGTSADNYTFAGYLNAPRGASGRWTLRVQDKDALDVGTLRFFNVSPE